MIVVDTSALIAILLGEPEAGRCIAALEADDDLLVSAGTMAEALVVAARRGVPVQMQRLLGELGFEIVSVTEATARQVAEAYERWGKGQHPAALNFGDCFAYALAKERGCPLLYVGDDFFKTDIATAH